MAIGLFVIYQPNFTSIPYFAVVVLGSLSNGTFLKELILAHKVNLRGF